jgi:hypothetical protein
VCVWILLLSLSLSLYCDFVLAPICISYDDVSGHTKRSVEREICEMSLCEDVRYELRERLLCVCVDFIALSLYCDFVLV